MKIRNFSPKDLDSYKNLYKAAGEEMVLGVDGPFFGFEKKMRRPNFIPTRDILLVENKTGETRGFALIRFEHVVGRVIIDCFVRPEYRRLGLGKELLRHSLLKAREQHVEKAHVCVIEGNTPGQEFLLQAGFASVRRHLRLRLDMPRYSAWGKAFESSRLKNFSRGQENLLAKIQNEVFKGSWGFCPNTEADIKFFLKLTECRLKDILLLCEGERRVGYLWPHTINREKASDCPQRGRIHMCGIIKEFRGRGWGRQLIASGLLWFKQRGISNIELTVDSQNVPAVTLYKSIGFATCHQEIWYELSLK